MRWRHGRERTAERTISVHSLASIRLFSRRVQVYAWTCPTRKSWAWQAAACYRHGKAPAAVTRWCPMQTWPSGYLRPGATPADNEPLALTGPGRLRRTPHPAKGKSVPRSATAIASRRNPVGV